MAGHLLAEVVAEGEVGGAISIVHGNTGGGLVYMALHDVAVESAVHQHRPLHVHLVAYAQQTQVRAVQRFLHRRHHVVSTFDAHHRQAHPVVGDALVDAQLVGERASQREIDVFPVVTDGYNRSKFLNNA